MNPSIDAVVTVLLVAGIAAVFAAIVCLIAVAVLAVAYLVGEIRRSRAEQRAALLAERAHQPADPTADLFDSDWPVLDREPPVVFPRRRTA